MATIRERTKANGKKSYQAIVRKQGQSATQTFSREIDAQRWAAKLELDLEMSSAHPQLEARKHKLTEAIDLHVANWKGSDYSTLQRLSWFDERYGQIKLHQITSPWIRVRLREIASEPGRRGVKRADGTINRYHNAISGDPRTIPLVPDAVTALREYRRECALSRCISAEEPV